MEGLGSKLFYIVVSYDLRYDNAAIGGDAVIITNPRIPSHTKSAGQQKSCTYMYIAKNERSQLQITTQLKCMRKVCSTVDQSQCTYKS